MMPFVYPSKTVTTGFFLIEGVQPWILIELKERVKVKMVSYVGVNQMSSAAPTELERFNKGF